MTDWRVGVIDAPVFATHDAGPGHPERPERVAAVHRALDGSLPHLTPRPARRDELRRVHSERLIDSVLATRGTTVRFDPDTQAGPLTAEAALMAAGSVVDAVSAVLDGTLDRVFCNVRPPGHHAESDRVMGFCYFNNVAVAAAHALARGLERVLIVDWDVHHGNGTQEIFEADPRVLYVSSHQFPFYPGTGALDEVGTGAGRGFTVNLPLPAGCGDAEYSQLYEQIVLPIARQFAPQLVIVSAGYDPYDGDPLAGMRVTPAGFARLAELCLQMAPGGRAVFALEGGYDLEGLTASAAATVEVLQGGRPGVLDVRPSRALDPLLETMRLAHAPSWSGLRSR